MPWLKKEPRQTPNKIQTDFTLEEKDKTSNCVLSPNSDKNTSKKATKKAIIANPSFLNNI